MDNLTHTLVGLIVGEAAARGIRADPAGLPEDKRRQLFVGLMAIGSNVPDLDFIQSRITGSKLDYLLHHRGHTHTIVGALLLALILYACCEAWCRWRQRQLSSRDRAQLLGVGLLASLLHIALDFTNSYGVHPFWPFDNRWYYGDSVFIVEPLFWAASAPLVFLLRSKLAKAFVGLALFAGVGLSIATGMVPPPLWMILLLVTVALLALGKFAPARIALAASLFVWVGVNGTYLAARRIAADRASSLAVSTFEDQRLFDTVLTPMPVNPFCWQVIFVQATNDDWFIRRAALALAPTWLPAQSCPSRSDADRVSAPVTRTGVLSTAEIRWLTEMSVARATLREWVAKDCEAAAFMRFARAPWIARVGEHWVIGDARFDNERGLSFAEIELDETRAQCAPRVAPWVEPRQDLLENAR